jgi:hypothetical protein
MTILQAKQIVKKAFTEFNGFESRPDDQMWFNLAGQIKFGMLSESDLLAIFQKH